MGFDFNHLLVPLDPEYVPETTALASFLEEVVRQGFVGPEAERIVKVFPDFERLDAWFFWGIAGDLDTPMTGTTRGPRATRWTRAETAEDLQRALQDAPKNLQATVWSSRRPPRPPLRGLEVIDEGTAISMNDPRFEDEYWIAITCHLSERTRSMSDDGHPPPSPFGSPATTTVGDAIAYCPSTLARHVAKGIGAARSWISISTGGWVSPSASAFDEHDLELADPSLVAIAERFFGVDLGQTCAWSL
jgi:hypothetical protein